jgi:hypothetical protein
MVCAILIGEFVGAPGPVWGKNPDPATVPSTQGDSPVFADTKTGTVPTQALPLEIESLLLVDQRAPWLAAVSAPVVARLRGNGQLPLLLAVSVPPDKGAEGLLGRIRPRRSVLLTGNAGTERGQTLTRLSPEVIDVGADPAEASLRIAKRFWGGSPEVLVAAADDPAMIILGASLAAQKAIPLLLHDPWSPDNSLRRSLDALGVQRVLVASGEQNVRPAWLRSLRQEVTVLDHRILQRRTVVAIGASSIGNVVVARTPDDELSVGRTAWLSPYVGLARHAPVVLCDRDEAAEAERQVTRLIESEGLRPRSITLLADYLSIGTRVVKTDPDANVDRTGESKPSAAYEIVVEPFLPTGFQQLASYDLGRIPFDSLERASALFAAGLLRPRLLAGRPACAVMVANPDLSETPLPFCETVARATATELKNCRVRLDEFYRAAPDAPALLEAARSAHLIIFQGHIDQEYMFHGPLPPEDQSKPPTLPLGPRMKMPMDGMPVVVLQTCHSLSPEVFDSIQELGGAAVLGTATSLHSGSGSAFLKTVTDGVLYRGETLGEAVRNARNYLFCVQELKRLRGHKEQAKTQRVALSFCLWGDPEVRPFPQGVGAPVQAPVTARWQSAGRLSVALPAERLPAARAGSFEAQLFPGSQVAGLVEGKRTELTRRLLPLYFFRLPMPAGFAAADCRGLQRSNGDTQRGVVRADPAGRFLYVLYLPQREKAEETFTLHCLPQGAP